MLMIFGNDPKPADMGIRNESCVESTSHVMMGSFSDRYWSTMVECCNAQYKFLFVEDRLLREWLKPILNLLLISEIKNLISVSSGCSTCKVLQWYKTNTVVTYIASGDMLTISDAITLCWLHWRNYLSYGWVVNLVGGMSDIIKAGRNVRMR